MERAELIGQRRGHNPASSPVPSRPPQLLPEQQNNFTAYRGQRKLLQTLFSRAYFEHIELTPIVPFSLERHHDRESQN